MVEESPEKPRLERVRHVRFRSVADARWTDEALFYVFAIAIGALAGAFFELAIVRG